MRFAVIFFFWSCAISQTYSANVTGVTNVALIKPADRGPGYFDVKGAKHPTAVTVSTPCGGCQSWQTYKINIGSSQCL